MNRRLIVLVVVAAVAIVAALLLGFALGRSGDESSDAAPRTIIVTGTGKVEATPDVADLNLGVSATSKSAQAARAAADSQLRRVLAALEARGVAPADIQTSQVSLSPNFSRNGATVVGYTATNSVTAKIRKLDTAGAVVTAAAAAGANDISGPMLSVSNQKVVYQQALKEAVADARTHAEAIAEATGDTVGELRSAAEGSENMPFAYEASANVADAKGAPIEPGTLEITANVTATFELD